MNFVSLCSTFMIIINATKFEMYIKTTDTIMIAKPATNPCSYRKPTIISVMADIISKIEPKLIITEGKRVPGYKHLIPIDTPTTKT